MQEWVAGAVRSRWGSAAGMWGRGIAAGCRGVRSGRGGSGAVEQAEQSEAMRGGVCSGAEAVAAGPRGPAGGC